MEISDDYPDQIKDILLELNSLIAKSPIEGSRVILGQNGTLEETLPKKRHSFISCAIIENEHIEELLPTLDVPGNILQRLGQPFYGDIGPEKNKYFEYDIPDHLKGKIEVFLVQQTPPNGSVHFFLKPDFLLFYDLIPSFQQGRIRHVDSTRGIEEVIIQDTVENVTTISVLKEYLLDYLALRHKSLLIGMYYGTDEPASEEIPDGFRLSLSHNTRELSARISIWKDKWIDGDKVYTRLDMYKIIKDPSERVLGTYGLMPSPPDVEVNTGRGMVKVNDVLRKGSDAFYTRLYFNADVLIKYEKDKNFSVNDDGGVKYGGVWAVFRGIYRVGDELIYTNIQDLFESLPYEEWSYWKAFNVPPLSIEEHQEIRDIQTIQKKVNVLTREIDSFSLSKYISMSKIVGTHSALIYKISENTKNFVIPILKHTFTRRTTKEAFLDRVVQINKVIVDSLNGILLAKYIDIFYPEAKFNLDKTPKASLKLLLTFLELRIIFNVCQLHLKQEDIKNKVREYYDVAQPEEVDTSGDFILDSIFQRIKRMREGFSHLFTVYALRTKGGGAHAGSDEEFSKSMEILGFEREPTSYLPIYRRILDGLIEFYSNF